MAAAPDAPTSLSVTAGNQSLTISWSAPTNLNGAALVIGYQMHWECGQASGTQLTTATTYTLGGRVNGVSCDVRVQALATNTNASLTMWGPFTAPVTATPTAG